MKIKSGFNLRDICGEQVVIAEGLEHLDFSKMIHLNESAAYLWQRVQDTDFTPEKLAEMLCEEYDVDSQTALSDAKALVAEWQKEGLIED